LGYYSSGMGSEFMDTRHVETMRSIILIHTARKERSNV